MIKLIKNKFYALIFWRTSLGEIINKVYDLKIHFKYSFKLQNNKEREQLFSYLQKQFHVIEKGMALPNPRPGFGEAKINDIIKNAKFYIKNYNHDIMIDSLIDTLNDYIDFNKKSNQKLESDFYKNIINFIKDNPNKNKSIGGIKKITKTEIQKATNIDFNNFIKTRVSVRDFDDKNIPNSLIIDSINIAKFAPSVCNRQGWKTHLYTDKKRIKALLSLQNGNRGFTNSINKLIIITGDTTAFTKYESNQIFIDGGLFAMNLILALHSNEIGSIALNTDIPYIIEKRMKKEGDIHEKERLIMMLGIGFLKDNFNVAYSNRKESEQILNIHEN